MSDSTVYILFGNKKSVANYCISVDYLIEKKTSLDYFVHSYKLPNYKHSFHFIQETSRYQEFLRITKQEFETIYHDLCIEGRNFMKND
jgi:hypothetical protein